MTNTVHRVGAQEQRKTPLCSDYLDPERHLALTHSVPAELFINGAWVPATNGGTYEVENPATGEVIATLANASAEDAQKAVDAAAQAQRSWAATPATQRAELLHRIFALVQRDAGDIAALMTLEMGKPYDQALGEVTYGAEFLRWFADHARNIGGRYTDAPEGHLRMIIRRRPIGPAYLVTPWNFPLAMATRKLAPALAAGCTTILKPSELTPLTSHKLVALCQEAGVPAGVVNLLSSTDAPAVSDVVLNDSRMRKISFTGSTAVGRHLIKQAANNVLRTSMELGGNAPCLVLADADLDLAVQGALDAKMRNMGQACTAANRFIVHESIADEFAQRLAERMGHMQCGFGLEPNVDVGPVIDARALDRIAALVEDAQAQGATVLCGGKRIEGPGNFYAPTVLANVPADAAVLREEIFGPIAPVISFSSLEEAVELANNTEYGLASYIFSQDIELALDLAENIEAGLAGINTGLISNAAAPFGGLKQSGTGREGGVEGLDDYTDTQYLALPRGRRFQP